MGDKEYGASQIVEMSQLDHIRHNPSMYIGSTDDVTPLLFELFDNAVDEALAGFAKIIGVFIDNKSGIIKVLDSGRGFPFQQSLPIDQDPPVLACTKLFTSGKFKKGDADSAYKISSGLHGVGITSIYALSDWMKMEIYRNGIHATYDFKSDGSVTRSQESFEGNQPFSTKVEFKPNAQYFTSTKVNLQAVEERIKIVIANYPDLTMIFRVDGKDQVIGGGTETDLIEQLLSKKIEEWFSFDVKNPNSELCHVKFGWEPGTYGVPKILTAVNLVRVHEGVHVNKLYNILRDIFTAFAKKHKYQFNKDDCLQGIRIYLNLHIIKTAFAAQVKTKLETAADIGIMDGLEAQIKTYFQKDETLLLELMDRFQAYRNALQNKKLVNVKSSGGRRSSSKFTKLRDCSEPMGELIIGEGDSAVGGLIQFRDPKKHAILPLRGVIPNALTMDKKKLQDNAEVKDIIQAVGTGILTECNIANLRYSKIIIATDADPAGHWIASLLIILFASLMPDVIKNGHLYICRTPLYGVHRGKQFIPLWRPEDVEEVRLKGEHISRYKGLGEFQPSELKVFTLDESTRVLLPVGWSDKTENLFELFTSAVQKRKLVTGTWSIDE